MDVDRDSPRRESTRLQDRIHRVFEDAYNRALRGQRAQEQDRTQDRSDIWPTDQKPRIITR